MEKTQKSWSEEELKLLHEAILDNFTPQETAALFPDRSYNSVNVKRKREARKIKGDMNSTIKKDVENYSLSQENKRCKALYKTSLKEIAKQQEIIDVFTQTADKTKTTKIKNVKDDDSESVFFMVASDWHCGKKIEKSRVCGVNEFNVDIFDKRSDNFFVNSVCLLKQFENNTKVNTICLALLGDFIENYIHEEQTKNNTIFPTEEILRVQNKLASGIEFLLNNTDKNIYIPCVVGNHGRTTKKMHISTQVKDSYEWVIYNNLKFFFKDNPRVEFDIADGEMLYKKFYDYTLRFLHGTSIRYSGGIGGIFIAGNKAIASWNKVRAADLTIFGHFHQTKFSGWGGFICNGSLCGYDEYALSIKADYERPQQSCFLLDKKRGLTIQAPILLEQN